MLAVGLDASLVLQPAKRFLSIRVGLHASVALGRTVNRAGHSSGVLQQLDLCCVCRPSEGVLPYCCGCDGPCMGAAGVSNGNRNFCSGTRVRLLLGLLLLPQYLGKDLHHQRIGINY